MQIHNIVKEVKDENTKVTFYLRHGMPWSGKGPMANGSFFNPLDHPCRVSSDYYVVVYVLCDNSPSSDCGVFAHRHARQDSGACANPAITLQVDWLAGEDGMVVEVMVVGDELGIGGYKYVVVDGYARSNCRGTAVLKGR